MRNEAGQKASFAMLGLLGRLSEGCGKLPLLAALILAVSARLSALVEPAPPDPLAAMRAAAERASTTASADPDQVLITQVLSVRAPGLGLTLRRQLAQAISEEAKAAGYDPLLILAIIDVESDFEEEAISNKGARGLMQIKPSTLYFLARKLGLKLSREEVAEDPALCVRLGIRYLKMMQNQFKGDLELALMAYNAGPGRIRGAIRQGDLDKFRRYPALVRRDFGRFRKGAGLGTDWALALRPSLHPK